MRLMSLIVVILLLAVPVFAVFLLLHRLENDTRDKDAGMKFYEALREQYGKNTPEKKKRALTEEERIALAKRISEDPFADVTASDVMTDEPEAENTAASEESADNEKKTVSQEPEAAAEAEGKMSREDALAAVSALMGSSREKNKKNKGRNRKDSGLSAMTELEITLAKYRSQIESNKNETK